VLAGQRDPPVQRGGTYLRGNKKKKEHKPGSNQGKGSKAQAAGTGSDNLDRTETIKTEKVKLGGGGIAG